MRFRAITFDCYGTLIDWDHGIGRWIEERAASEAPGYRTDELLERFAVAQRIEQTRTPFQSYRSVLVRALRTLGEEMNFALTEEDAHAFAATASTWPPFSDSVEALAELKRQGRVLGVLSNVDNDLFEGSRNLLGDPFDLVVTAEDVRSYKPALPHFHVVRERLACYGIGEDAILHVARSKFHDVATANELGWANCWINRREGESGRGVGLPCEAEPTWQTASMAGFLDLLDDVDPV